MDTCRKGLISRHLNTPVWRSRQDGLLDQTLSVSEVAESVHAMNSMFRQQIETHCLIYFGRSHDRKLRKLFSVFAVQIGFSNSNLQVLNTICQVLSECNIDATHVWRVHAGNISLDAIRIVWSRKRHTHVTINPRVRLEFSHSVCVPDSHISLYCYIPTYKHV